MAGFIWKGKDIILLKQGYEVLFPTFTTNTPVGAYNVKSEVLSKLPDKYSEAEMPPPVKFPFDKMSHITHFDSAMVILQNDLTFTAEMKVGKGGYSFKHITGDDYNAEYSPLNNSSAILSGHYSWWIPEPPEDAEAPVLLHGDGIATTLSNVFLTPPSSQYGSIKFTTSFNTLLKRYQAAAVRDNLHFELQYKLGGTLRYRNEICRMVIVTVIDNDYDPLPELPNTDLPEESIELPFTKFGTAETVPKFSSWDHTILGLHFATSDEGKSFKLPADAVDVGKVAHNCFNETGKFVRLPHEKRCMEKMRSGECPDAAAYHEQDLPFDKIQKEMERIPKVELPDFDRLNL